MDFRKHRIQQIIFMMNNKAHIGYCLNQLERLLQEKDEELARLDSHKKNEFRDTQRLSEIERTISEIRRSMRYLCS